jgi:hypothetical protein
VLLGAEHQLNTIIQRQTARRGLVLTLVSMPLVLLTVFFDALTWHEEGIPT